MFLPFPVVWVVDCPTVMIVYSYSKQPRPMVPSHVIGVVSRKQKAWACKKEPSSSHGKTRLIILWVFSWINCSMQLLHHDMPLTKNLRYLLVSIESYHVISYHIIRYVIMFICIRTYIYIYIVYIYIYAYMSTSIISHP